LDLGGGRRRDSAARPSGVHLELGSGELSAGATTRATVLVLGGPGKARSYQFAAETRGGGSLEAPALMTRGEMPPPSASEHWPDL
jgi:hypothetical protein